MNRNNVSDIFATLLQKLNRYKSYRFWGTLFLLFLYAFILVPVQLWHQHPPAIVGHSSGQPDFNSSKYLPGSVSSVDSNCSVCEHKYSEYGKEFFFAVGTLWLFRRLENPSRPLPIVSSIHYYDYNRGPPSV